VGAGTGSVYLLRWYWWRINAWSEIAAMSTALIVSLGIRWWTPFHGSEPSVFARQTLVTTALTSAVWIIVTLVTPPEPSATLVRFYRRVRPDAFGWKPIAQQASDLPIERELGRNLCSWVSGCATVYFALFGIGKMCLLEWRWGGLLLLFSLACGAVVYSGLSRSAPEPQRRLQNTGNL
jgi:SSS family solute:Na+ symporter